MTSEYVQLPSVSAHSDDSRAIELTVHPEEKTTPLTTIIQPEEKVSPSGPAKTLRLRKSVVDRTFVDLLPGVADDSDNHTVDQPVKPVDLKLKATIPCAKIQPPDEVKECQCADGILANFGLVKIWNTQAYKYLDPALYLTCSGEVLVVMLIVGWVVTLVIDQGFIADNILHDTIGYNDICVGFDTPPASYITAILYGAFVYMSVRFAWTDISRVAQEYRDKQSLTTPAFIYSYAVNVMYMASAAIFVLVFVIPPQVSLWAHFMSFLQIVLVRWLVVLSYFFRQLPPTRGQCWGLAMYTIISFGFFVCMVLDLVYQPAILGIDDPFVPYQLGAFFDYSWFVSLLFTHSLLPKQPRLLSLTVLERFTLTPVVSSASVSAETKSQSEAVLGSWKEGSLPSFENKSSHNWNWEYLNTWVSSSQRLAKYMCCGFFTGFGKEQYDNKCVNVLTLCFYWVWLFLWDLVALPLLAVCAVGWLGGVLVLGFLRTLEIWGFLTIQLSRLYAVDMNGARDPKLHCKDVWVARPVPRELRYDFHLYRTPGYLLNTVMSWPSALSRVLSFRAQPPIIKDELLNLVAFGSWVSHLLVANDKNDPNTGYLLDCSVLRHVVSTKDSYMRLESVHFSSGGEVTSIAIHNGGEHKPGDKLWPLAKAHLQGSILGLRLCWTHSWQNSVFPNAAAVAQQRLPRSGVLYKLLAPHLRFTLYTNQVKDHGLVIEKQESWFRSALLPLTSDEFLVHNSVKTNTFFFPDSKDNREGEQHGGFKERLSGFQFPPCDGVTAAKDAYHYMLFAYYKVIREHVVKVWPDVKSKDWALWKSYVVPVLKFIDQANPVDVLATLIWTLSIVHSADHCSLGEGRAYWISSTRKDWDPADAECPRNVFAGWQYCRTQSFFDVYGTRWMNPVLPLSMSRIDHDFDQNHLMEADHQLREALVNTDKDLHAAGCAVVPLEALLTCLCF